MTEAALRERPVTSRQIRVGDVPIGGGARVAVQSMTNTMTYDVEATVQQVRDIFNCVVTNWNQIPGGGNGPIQRVFPSNSSGTGDTFIKKVLGGTVPPSGVAGCPNVITAEENPARRTAKPRRQASVRHALSTNQMSEINFYASTTGDDPELDTLLLRLHTESACRTGGALALRPRDLNEDQCLIYLREKDGTARWQPISRSLMTALLDHAETRGAAGDPGGQLLREAFSGILEELGNQYTLAYRPTNRARDGKWRAIDIKLARAELNARTRKGYRAPKA